MALGRVIRGVFFTMGFFFLPETFFLTVAQHTLRLLVQ